MNKTLLALGLTLVFAAPAAFAGDAANKATKPQLGSFGIDLGNRDLSVKPGDDFDRYANGHWFDNYQMRDYDTRFGSFNALSDRAEEQARAIIEELQTRKDLKPGSDEQKVRDLYASYMDTAARDAAGITPLKPTLARIAGIDSIAALTAAFGRAGIDGTSSPVGGGVTLDRKNPDRYLVNIGVGGLGLPDKDYYLNAEPRFVQIRAAYLEHVGTMLGVADAKPRAEAVIALETELAKHLWDRAQWRGNWDNIIPFFQFLPQIRKVIYTTNAIESLNMVMRKLTRNRRIFPNDDSARKSLFSAIREASKNWKAIHHWKPALQSFQTMFGEERVPLAAL